jgi:hypothetical protein
MGDEYFDYTLIGGPLDGLPVSFPLSYIPQTLEFWLKGWKNLDHPFHRYTLDELEGVYQYDYKTGKSLDAQGADYSYECWPEPHRKMKEVGQLSTWTLLEGTH